MRTGSLTSSEKEKAPDRTIKEAKATEVRTQEVPTHSLPPAATMGTVGASLLNVRLQPNVLERKIGELRKGDTVWLLEEMGSWYHIKAYNGYLEGWVAKEYIRRSPTG